MILAFSHPGVVVSDLEQARVFYEQMFGFRVLSEEGWSGSAEADRAVGTPGSACKGYMMAGHNCFLELFVFTAPAQEGPAPAILGAQEQGIRHLAFYVDDVKKETARFIELGGHKHGEPEGSAVYLRDPFGNIIELCEIPNERENPTSLPGVNALSEFGA